MKTVFALLALAGTLCGCSMLPANINRAEETAMTAAVQSSERTICRDIPVGTWMRLYGANAARLSAWQGLCTNPAVAPISAPQEAK